MARKDNDDNINSGGGALTGSTVWWGAGGLIVLVLIGLVWILIGGNGSGSTTATPTRTVTAAPPGSSPSSSLTSLSPASSSASTAANGCNLPGGTTAVPTSVIPVTWQAVGGIAAPVSASAGPARISGTQGALRSCYQHSPTGAVLAAMNIAAAATTPSEQQVIQQGYTPGPGRQEAMAQPADSGGGSISGFTTQACTQSVCLVKLAFTVQGLYIEQSMPMIWAGDDWKVNGQVTGVAQAQQVTGLAAYIAMSPIGGAS